MSNTNKKWTKLEDKILERMMHKYPLAEMARILGRREGSIRNRIQVLATEKSEPVTKRITHLPATEKGVVRIVRHRLL